MKSATPAVKSRKPARTKLLEGNLALDQISGESRKHAACVLEVLAGLRSPEQAAEALGLSLQTYYNLESRALRGLIHGCTPTPPGRTLMLLKQVRSLEIKSATLEKQLGRYQALLRNAQRAAGLSPPTPAAAGKSSGGRRRRPPAVRALRAVEALQRERPPAGQEPAAVSSTADAAVVS
ncbi:MAG TPA: hypothetical protein VGI81_24710 [Tepidisphaeraceae bacterium]